MQIHSFNNHQWMINYFFPSPPKVFSCHSIKYRWKYHTSRIQHRYILYSIMLPNRSRKCLCKLWTQVWCFSCKNITTLVLDQITTDMLSLIWNTSFLLIIKLCSITSNNLLCYMFIIQRSFFCTKYLNTAMYFKVIKTFSKKNHHSFMRT